VGPESNPNGIRDRPESGDTALEIRVCDVIELKASFGTKHAPGVVLVLEAFRVDPPESLVGRVVSVRAPHGRSQPARIGDVRDHGPTISLFFEELPRDYWSIGTTVIIPAEATEASAPSNGVREIA
jgi:hypothetical protein